MTKRTTRAARANEKHFFMNNKLETPWTGQVNRLTIKAPRKPASENVVCLCRLLNIPANFSNLVFAYQ